MKYYSNYPHDKNLSETYDPTYEERKILDLWCEKRTSEKIQEIRRNENKGTISFLWGPPFATGSPHCGHILNSIIKDVFVRYAYQKKLKVACQFGWDCHGLPVEHEVDKKLEVQTREDIMKIGVSKYNEECRKFVERNQAEWSEIYERVGNWVNFNDTYSTMTKKYMESVWEVFQMLFNKGLVYKDTKVLPFSTTCFTNLSNFEAEQNWKRVNEVSVTFALRIVGSGVKLLIWQVGIWKLAANLAVCVNPNAVYVKVKMILGNQVFIVSKNRLPYILTNAKDYTLLEEIRGKHLQNLQYQPLFGYMSENFNAFKIFLDDSVREDVGTGIVALSPHFAEYDYCVCTVNGVVVKEDLCPIDDSAVFKRHIPELAGLKLKQAERVIIEYLRSIECLIGIENVKRERPHCWRSDTPLISKATSTWFVRIGDLCATLEEKNDQVKWFPGEQKEEMKDRLSSSMDWPIGRKRYWGTPVPVWMSPSGDEVRCVGSIQELLELTGTPSITDLHREFVDKLQIPSRIPGKPPLRRVPEVLDCWFETGILPLIRGPIYSQVDCIIESTEQVHGFFYSTSVVTTAIGLPPPAKNILAHGLVECDGMKISKRKYNNSDPIRIVEKYGADALRLYLLSSPLVAGENFTFQEQGVAKMIDDVITPVYKILYDLMPHFGKQGWVSYGIIVSHRWTPNIFDQWILSSVESFVQFYDDEMKSFRLHRLMPRVRTIINHVQNWYIPIRRVKVKPCEEDGVTFILYNVIFKILQVLAPIVPFFTEHVYQILKPWVAYDAKDHIHHLELTERCNDLVLKDVEIKIARWQKIIEMVRDIRMMRVIPIKYRINDILVLLPCESYFQDSDLLNETLLKLANVRQAIISSDRNKYGARLKADLKTDSSLSPELCVAEHEALGAAIRCLKDKDIEEAVRDGCIHLRGFHIPVDDLIIKYEFKRPMGRNRACTVQGGIAVIVRMNKDLSYYEEGTRLELVTTVQKLRRKANIFPTESATIFYSTKDRCMLNAFQKYLVHVSKSTNSIVKSLDEVRSMEDVVAQDDVNIKGVPVSLHLHKRRESEV